MTNLLRKSIFRQKFVFKKMYIYRINLIKAIMRFIAPDREPKTAPKSHFKGSLTHYLLQGTIVKPPTRHYHD